MSRPCKAALRLAPAMAIALACGCLEEERLQPVSHFGDGELREVTVIAPNGGESWQAGSIQTITWLTEGIGSTVDIALLRGGQVCTIIANSAANTGTFDWTCTVCGQDTTGYQIRVSDAASTALDVSDQPFTVAIPSSDCTVQVTEPDRDRVWIEGQVMHIAWSSEGILCGGTVMIELIQNSEPCRCVTEVTPNDGSFDWVVCPCSSDSTQYRIRVTDLASGAWDENNCNLTLLGLPPAPCSVTLLAPNGGERWVEGRIHTITWESATTCGPTVDLTLVHPSASLQELIAAGVPNDGSHAWVAHRLGEASEGYFIRVTDTAGGASDESDGPFSILEAGDSCAPALVFPNGGETWAAGEPYLISWDWEGACGELVAIDLLRAGSPCQTISAATPNTGTFIWTASQCSGQPDGYAIRVTDLTSGAADASDGSFSIFQPCAITVTAPQGGEVLLEGARAEITWLRAGTCNGPVAIDLLRAGAVCRTIATGVPNSGSYAWIAERCGSATAGYRVRVTDLASGRGGESPGTFAIEGACALRLYAPNGGEAWVAGRVETVNWLPTGACAEVVAIDLLRDGVLCAQLASAAPNTGRFDWRAQQVGGHEAGYRIRITEPGGTGVDQSYGPFSILDACELDLLWPDGGESLVSGSEEFITWDPSATCGEQVRIDLLHGGVLCQTLAAVAANTGRFAWEPQPCAGAGTGYRIAVTDLTSLAADTSAADFEIRASVYLSFAAEGGGWVAHTNNPLWSGRVDLVFDAEETHQIGSPAWLPADGSALILRPDDDLTASFFPALASGQGLDLDTRCCGVEVKLTGCAQEASTLLGLEVATNARNDCRSALPVTTDLRQMSARFARGCVRSSGPLRIEVTFTNRHAYPRAYAVRQVEYIFPGWPAP